MSSRGVSGDMPLADISSERAAGDAEPAAAGSEHAASGAASAAEPDGSLAEPPPTASGAQSVGPPRRYKVRNQIDRADMHRLEGQFTVDEVDAIVKTPTVRAFDRADVLKDVARRTGQSCTFPEELAKFAPEGWYQIQCRDAIDAVCAARRAAE